MSFSPLTIMIIRSSPYLCACANNVTQENDLSTSLSEAYKMVTKLVQSTLSAAQDAEDEIIEAEAAYRIKLEAHSRFMQKISDDMDLLYAR